MLLLIVEQSGKYQKKNPINDPNLFEPAIITCGVAVVVGNVIPLGFDQPVGRLVGTL